MPNCSRGSDAAADINIQSLAAVKPCFDVLDLKVLPHGNAFCKVPDPNSQVPSELSKARRG